MYCFLISIKLQFLPNSFFSSTQTHIQLFSGLIKLLFNIKFMSAKNFTSNVSKLGGHIQNIEYILFACR